MKRRKIVTRDVYLCLDCIGEIISFLSDQETFFNIFYLSKRVKSYIENENPTCARNVLFWVHKPPKSLLQRFVSRCRVEFKVIDLKFFKRIQSLNIFQSSKITDKGLKYLTGIKSLTLNRNNGIITDEGLKYLTGIKSLTLNQNNGIITDEGLKYLTGIKELNLNSNRNITDKGLKHLKGIQKLKLFENTNITDEGLDYLKGIQSLDVHWNRNVTYKGLKYLTLFCISLIIII